MEDRDELLRLDEDYRRYNFEDLGTDGEDVFYFFGMSDDNYFTVNTNDQDDILLGNTVEYNEEIGALYPDAELFFITGADAVAEIMQWKDADLMWDLAHFVAVTRPGYSSPDGVTLPEGKVDTLEIPALAISSTDVRRRAEHDEPVWYLVPDGVVQYIGKHGLYSYED